MGIYVSKRKRSKINTNETGSKAEEQRSQEGRVCADHSTEPKHKDKEKQVEEQNQLEDAREHDDQEEEEEEDEDGENEEEEEHVENKEKMEEEEEDDEDDDDDDDEDEDDDDDEEEEEEREVDNEKGKEIEEEVEEGDDGEENNVQATKARTYSEQAQNALMGDFDSEFPENVKVVRIFTSSTFTDTSVERNTLMERVYPRLKSYCQERGYDFQVVDMRWGVRDESTDDHMTTELCMRELRACQKLSTGPNFITFLGQKYGYRPFPPKIAASEFEKLLSAVDNEEDLQLLKRWFWRDDNAVPAQYLLQSITSLLPHYRNYDNNDLRKEASGEWWTAFERMQVVLRKAADKALKKTSERQKYYMSVTEEEIRRGIINTSNPSKHCFWFKRIITDLHQNIDHKNTGKFIDKAWGADASVDTEAQKLLKSLRENGVPQALPNTNVIDYNVTWVDSGIDPTASEEHAQYIEKLCSDFYDTLTRMIDDGIGDQETSHLRESFAEEIFQHGSFCQKKCKSFHGRKGFLTASKETLLDNEKHAVILFGESGCGKTSIMAKIATQVKQWLGEESAAVVVLRFIGTSPDSSSIRPLLRSVCLQLCKATGQDSTNMPEDMKSLKEVFLECLENSAELQPVVLMLDSLDQLSIDEGGRQMDWFPRQLPPNVYTILSTLPGQEYQALPALRSIMPGECFLEVPKIPLSEADAILDNWLKANNRILLSDQKRAVMDAFQKCPLPLYLKLAFDEACRWKSYTPDNDIRLEETVRDIIDDLFNRIERRHGKVLVSNALAYITASKNGLTESELEDLLSLDDQVLNDVYQYWTPPVRRLPPLLWIRIRSDIGEYLTERGADGTQVIFWYHRQFIEAAKEKYLTCEQMTTIHKNMSDYFLGKWSGGVKKPYVNKEGQVVSMDRLVAKQPLMFDTNEDRQIFNLRKLNELPFHLLRSEQFDKVKEECLCNFEFLSAKLRGTSLQVLMSDFTLFLDERPEDEDIKLLYECLQLSSHSLSKDKNQLPTQIIGRMFNFLQREEQYPDVYKVIKQAFNSSIACFIPNRKCLTAPGGALRSAIGLSQNTGSDVISIAKDNRTIAITSLSTEGAVIRIIDYRSGKEIRKFVMQEPHEMYQTNFNQISEKDPNLLLLAGSHKIFILDTSTGQIIQEFEVSDDEWFSYYPNAAGLVSFADDENMLVAICKDSLKIWQVRDGVLLYRIPLQGVNTEDGAGALDARGSHAVYNLRGKKTLHFVNVKMGKEIDKITLSFPKSQQGEDMFVKEVKITALDQVAVIPSSLDNLRLYDISGNLIREFSNFKMQQGLHNLQITDDCKKVVTADVYEICILDLNTGEVERCLRSAIFRLRIYTRDGMNILAVGQDNVLRFYDKTREDVDENQKDTVISKIQGHTIADQITAMSASFEQRHVLTTATVQLSNALDVWDALTGKRVRRLSKLMFFPNAVRMCTDTRGVGFIYDKDLPHYKVFDFAEGKIERILEGKACKRMNSFGFVHQTRMISFSRGRRFLKLWNVDTGKVIKVVQFREKRRFEEMLISNNGKMAVCSQASQMTQHSDKDLPLIAVETTGFSHKTLKCKGQQLSLFNARVSDDGKYLVSLVNYSQPFLWDLTAGVLMYKLFDPDKYETASYVGVSGQSMTAITGTNGDGIKVWSINSGQALRTIPCPDVSELFVSPDGEVVISRSQEANTFEAWEAKTGRGLATFTSDGYPNHVKIVGDRLALALAENPDLMILHLYRPAKSEKLSETDLTSPYDGLDLECSVEDVQEKPSAEDNMDTDKDDDDGFIC